MRLFRSLCASALLLVPSLAGAAVGFAKRTSDRTSFGAEIGGGGNWVNYMLVGGSHFAGAKSESLIELAHATVFMRTHFSERQHLDLGAKVSGFLHFDTSDDEPGGGYFIGLNAKYSWAKWRRLNLSPRWTSGAMRSQAMACASPDARGCRSSASTSRRSSFAPRFRDAM